MISLKIWAIFVLAFVFVAVSCAGGGNSSINDSNKSNANSANSLTPADELATASELYSKRCINCHKESGEGGVREVEGKKLKVPSFKDPRVVEATDEDYVGQIEGGGNGMPAYKGKISNEEIKNLVRFIRRDFQAK